MKDHVITGIIGILTLIIGVLLGYYTDILKEIKKNEIQYIDIEDNSSINTLRKISTKDKGEIKLIWNGVEINAISKISISIHNYTNKDFDKLSLTIALQPDGNDQVEIVDVKGTNENSLEDHTIRNGYPRTDSRGIVTYLIDLGVINRSNSYIPNYNLDFYIKGNNLPKVATSINEKGVKVREFKYSHLYENDYTGKIAPFVTIISITFFYAMLVIFASKYIKKKQLKNYAIYTNELSAYLRNSNNAIKDELADKIDEISLDIVHQLRISAWKNLSAVDKLLNRKKPEKKDLIEELTKVSS